MGYVSMWNLRSQSILHQHSSWTKAFLNDRGWIYLQPMFCANVYLSLLYAPNPEGQCAIDACVNRNRRSSVVLGVLESELVVPVECCGADCECSIPKHQADVGEKM